MGQGCFNGDGQGARIVVFSAYQGEDFYSPKALGSHFWHICRSCYRVQKFVGHATEVGGLFSLPVIPIR